MASAVAKPIVTEKKVDPSILVSPNQPFSGKVKLSGFSGSHKGSVTVIVISSTGVEQVTFMPRVGGDPDTQQEDFIVEQTNQVLYLERNEKNPQLARILRARSAAIQAAVIVADTTFTAPGGHLLHNGVDFRHELDDATKHIKAEFRADHPIDVHTEEDLKKPKKQRRHLKPAASLDPARLKLLVAAHNPTASASLETYKAFAAGATGVAAANAAEAIPDYTPRGGPRGDIDQRISNLRTGEESAYMSMHDAVMRGLYATRPAIQPVQGNA